jgi:hypothetical protein
LNFTLPTTLKIELEKEKTVQPEKKQFGVICKGRAALGSNRYENTTLVSNGTGAEVNPQTAYITVLNSRLN